MNIQPGYFAQSAANNPKVNEGAADKKKELGKDAFLNLLIAQLKNQDPLAPQGNSEFIAQLAQFSQVEGLQKLDESMAALLLQQRSAQALQAASLVGRQVLLVTDTSKVDTQKPFKGQVQLPVASEQVQVAIYDEKGNLVRQIEMGQQKAGEVPFEWDGKDDEGNPLPAGQYRFSAKARYEDGERELYSLLPATVDGVRMANGEVYLEVAGLGHVALSSVHGIQQVVSQGSALSH